MPAPELIALLDEHRVPYEILRHEPAASAQEIASRTHTSGDEVAKAVLVDVDGEPAVAVLPASHRIGIERLREGIGAAAVALLQGGAIASLGPLAQTGCIPPFGRLLGAQTILATALAESLKITFPAGSRTEAVRMRMRDYERVACPTLVNFSIPRR